MQFASGFDDRLTITTVLNGSSAPIKLGALFSLQKVPTSYRFVAGLFGFLIFSQHLDLPLSYTGGLSFGDNALMTEPAHVLEDGVAATFKMVVLDAVRRLLQEIVEQPFATSGCLRASVPLSSSRCPDACLRDSRLQK